MFVLAVVLICLVVSTAFRLAAGRAARAADPPPPARSRRTRAGLPRAELQAYPYRVQDRWTALDDRQVTRLLDDDAPC